MPSRRLISPNYWSDAKINQLSLAAAHLYPFLWGRCDDQGRGKLAVEDWQLLFFPGRFTIEQLKAMLQELQNLGRVILYNVDGINYFDCPHFPEHQNLRTPRPSKIPPPPKCSSSPLPAASIQPQLSLIFNLYENAIGTLTPHMADILRQAEKEYPSKRIQYAFDEAAKANVRDWRYVEKILQQGEQEQSSLRKRPTKRKGGEREDWGIAEGQRRKD